MANKKKAKFAMNDCGIKIKICCASCINKCLTASQRTFALHGDKEVKRTHVCREWGMDARLKSSGNNLGEVKKKAYLQFVMLRRWTEDRNIELGIMEEEECQTVEELREEFTGRIGGVYVG